MSTVKQTLIKLQSDETVDFIGIKYDELSSRIHYLPKESYLQKIQTNCCVLANEPVTNIIKKDNYVILNIW